MLKTVRGCLWLAGTVTAMTLAGCSAPPIDAFNITAGPANVAINPGSTATFNVASTSTGSKATSAAIILYNLPYGVSSTPASPTITTGSQTTITLTASPQAIAATSRVQVTGYADATLAYSTAYINVTVVP